MHTRYIAAATQRLFSSWSPITAKPRSHLHTSLARSSGIFLPSLASSWPHAVPRSMLAMGGAVSPIAKSFISTTVQCRTRNVLYDPVRSQDQFHTYLLHSSSCRQPLVTLWTASWCSTCKQVAPVIRDMVEGGTGEEFGGVAFCEVWAFDNPDARNMGMMYMLTTVPALLTFDDAQNPRYSTRIVDAENLGDRLFLKQWLETEAREGGSSGGGSNSMFGSSLGGGSGLGGLFGSWKK